MKRIIFASLFVAICFTHLISTVKAQDSTRPRHTTDTLVQRDTPVILDQGTIQGEIIQQKKIKAGPNSSFLQTTKSYDILSDTLHFGYDTDYWIFTSVPFTPEDPGIVEDVNVTIWLSSVDWLSELTVEFGLPDDTTIVLTNMNGPDSAGSYTNTTFDQEASTPITEGSVPFTGTFKPEEDLSYFNGEALYQEWMLKLVDDWKYGTEANYLEKVVVEFTYSDAPSTPDVIQIQDSIKYGDQFRADLDTETIQLFNNGTDTTYINSASEIYFTGPDAYLFSAGDTLTYPFPLAYRDTLVLPVEMQADSVTGLREATMHINFGQDDTLEWDLTANISPKHYGGGHSKHGGYYFSNNIAPQNEIHSRPTYKWIPPQLKDTLGASSATNRNQNEIQEYEMQWGFYQLPFTFPYFNITADKITFQSQGVVSFREHFNVEDPKAIPTPNDSFDNLPDSLIAGMWIQHLIDKSEGSKVYYDTFNDLVVITYERVEPSFLDTKFEGQRVVDYTSYYTGQIILDRNGRIIFQYNGDQSFEGTYNPVPKLISVGIENENGTKGISYRYNNEGGPIFHDEHNISVVFSKDSTQLYTPFSVVDSVEGWRMLSAPLNNFTFADLLDEFWTQGFTGSDNPSAGTSVYYYDESQSGSADNGFTTISSQSSSMNVGQGYLTYFFEDDTATTEEVNGGFPKILYYDGQEPTGQVQFPVSYTDTGSPSDDGWNLVGNPYAHTIDWDASSGWSRTNVDNAIYYWDPVNNVVASYVNGVSNNGGSSKIPPTQAFWIKANASSPSLKATEDVKYKPSIYAKGRQPKVLKLQIVGQDLSDETTLTFRNDGNLGKDGNDAYKLTPYSDNYISAHTSIEETHFDINNLPDVIDEQIDVPLHISGTQSGAYTIEVIDRTRIPSDWEIQLIDNRTDQTTMLQDGNSYSFEYESKSKSGYSSKPKHFTPTLFSNSVSDRFTIKIKTGTTTDIGEHNELPDRVALHQNYPNPFNPSTTIPFDVPNASPVKLELFNINGQKVSTLIDKNMPAGRHSTSFNANGLPTGIYFYRLQVNSIVYVNKMILLK
ncbi:MAG: T9SS type A sorting domain-containing protein [Bacteroidota bacterium]